MHNIQVGASLRTALNPGLDPTPAGKVLATLVAITSRHIWLDYCSFYFGSPKEAGVIEELLKAILKEFKVTLRAELRLLIKDKEWWDRKLLFQPALSTNIEVVDLVKDLEQRLLDLSELVDGRTTGEFCGLAPYDPGEEVIAIFN